jgi:putative copper export protein
MQIKALLDRTQIIVLLSTTGLTLFWLLSGSFQGFPNNYRVFDPEVWCYALAYSIGVSALCQATYFLMAISDLIRRKRRFLGWALCSAISALVVFVTLYLLPPPKSFFY